MTVTELPQPLPETGESVRWIPTRAGILNVWRYYDEVFEFHEGRLLLRGPNGSGKSKALELLLPFLFDANLRANRLSTFGTSERTMHWNLMGEGASGATRVGYVWLEFRLVGDLDQWFTCGARLQATSRTTSVHADYFTTELRVGAWDSGDELILTDAGRPLTRAALDERLGAAGTVHDSAADYRAAVRATLFPTLNEQRYDALITALLQLRTPKLSQRLDPALLSTLLSRALPPLSHDEIADLAEGFERLDAQRERLVRLDAEVAATRTLARYQRTYAQRVLRAGAAALISATTDLDRISSAAKRSAEECERTEQRKRATEQRIDAAKADVSQSESRRDGLMKTDAYKQGLKLDDLRIQTRGAEARANRADADAQRLQRVAASDAADHAAAVEAEQGRARIADNSDIEAQQAAHRAGLVSVYDELAHDPDSDHSRTLLRAAVRSRRDRLDDMTRALDIHERAVDSRTDAETALEAARTVFAEARQSQTRAAEERARELDALRERLRDWAIGCCALSFDDPDLVADLADSQSAVIETVNKAAASALEEVARQAVGCEREITDATSEREDLVAERDRLADEQDIPPTPPPWRTTDRSRMSGAPLWRLVDFAEGVLDTTAAGIEAALESAGLVDAWIGPRGEVEGHDVFADHTALEPVTGRSLADALVPASNAEVSPDVVRRLLATIAFDDRLPIASVVAVGADGGWRIGNLTGSWRKDQAAYIGASTRQRTRQRRIRQLDNEIAGYDRRLDDLDTQRRQLVAHRALIESERDGCPGHDSVLAAENRLTRTESDLAAADRQLRERLEIVSIKEAAVKSTLHALSALAADTGLPTERTALTALRGAIDDFVGQAEVWLDARRDLGQARATTADRADRAQRSADAAAERAEAAAEAEDEHRKSASELEAIEGSVGRDYREVLAEIADLRIRIKELTDDLEHDRTDLTKLAMEVGRLAAQHAVDSAARDNAAVTRDHVALRFRHLAAGTFPDDSAIPDVAKFRETLAGSEGVRAALDAARLVAAAWPTIPYALANLNEAVRRLNEAVHECRTALSARADLDLETDDDIQVFTAVIDGVRVGCAELSTLLVTEAEQSRNEITEQERRLFDQTLTGDTRRHLAARIRQANDLVDSMNARLKRVRTASDVAVQLVWQVGKDLPPGTKAARDLLLKDPVRLSDADRESLHRFLRDRIEEAKTDDTATSWEQQLAQVFDYTAWHRFVVKVDRGNGEGFQELTKKLHGALSGGEKAIALHLPLFAAVAAHYQAAPQAPRVILLDEVFVGVDSVNRGQIFALLSALDLDLMLTSDHEWCTYAELSGIGIHHIVGGDGDDAVTTARFTWDGEELLPV
ncbi:TIGR02680 family protein [Nocardia sp. NBC_00881]|uniref:TIGR02680 family protein n=1 Tax=Nocardia sp. NBC_00881 TaxID=2975995 RepID=UPI00386AAE56|nr:TIGR02680 family protein [Nocardia sp. NBC_00881]